MDVYFDEEVLFTLVLVFLAKISAGPMVVGIHSYEKDFPWTRLTLEAFEDTLKKQLGDVRFKNFFLNTKTHPRNISQKHPQYYKIIEFLKSNSVQAVYLTDDYAVLQFHEFLVSAKMPFVFSGLNSNLPIKMEAAGTGFSGVFERSYAGDSINLLGKTISKEKLNILILSEQSVTSKTVIDFAQQKLESMGRVEFQIVESNSFPIWLSHIRKAKKEHFDAILPLLLYSLKNEDKEHIKAERVFDEIYENSELPIVATTSWQISCGGALAVSHSPKSHGKRAAELVPKILRGVFPKPSNPKDGLIEINYSVLKKLGFKVPFDILTSAKIRKSIQTPCKAGR